MKKNKRDLEVIVVWDTGKDLYQVTSWSESELTSQVQVSSMIIRVMMKLKVRVIIRVSVKINLKGKIIA